MFSWEFIVNHFQDKLNGTCAMLCDCLQDPPARQRESRFVWTLAAGGRLRGEEVGQVPLVIEQKLTGVEEGPEHVLQSLLG